jgi:Tfp pilus assembly protein PilF
VVAAALGVEALHTLVHTGEAPRALEKIEKALRLDGRSPYLRTVRAAILVASGGLDEGVRELESASEIRPDAPRRNNLGAVYVAQRELESAEREVSAALAAYPDFAGAHATLGALRLAQADLDHARTELERAEQLEPDLFLLPMLWAQYHLVAGDPEAAARHAAEGVRRRPHDLQARLGATQVYRAAGQYDAMRREVREALALAPSGQEGVLRDQIRELLGPTAFDSLEEELEGEDEEEAGTIGLPSPDFQLGGGDLLGDPAPTTMPSGGPALGSDEGGPALMLGDPSKLRLRPEGDRLRLQLGD